MIDISVIMWYYKYRAYCPSSYNVNFKFAKNLFNEINLSFSFMYKIFFHISAYGHVRYRHARIFFYKVGYFLT